jgi:hypothetical protein
MVVWPVSRMASASPASCFQRHEGARRRKQSGYNRRLRTAHDFHARRSTGGEVFRARQPGVTPGKGGRVVECTGFEIRRTGSPVPRVRIPPFPPVESHLNRASPEVGLQVVDSDGVFGRMRAREFRAHSAMPYRPRLETATVSVAPDRDGFELEPYRERSQARRSADLTLGARSGWW